MLPEPLLQQPVAQLTRDASNSMVMICQVSASSMLHSNQAPLTIPVPTTLPLVSSHLWSQVALLQPATRPVLRKDTANGMNHHSIKLQVKHQTLALIRPPSVEIRHTLRDAKHSQPKINAKMRIASGFFLNQPALSDIQIPALTGIVIAKTPPRSTLARASLIKVNVCKADATGMYQSLSSQRSSAIQPLPPHLLLLHPNSNTSNALVSPKLNAQWVLVNSTTLPNLLDPMDSAQSTT